MMTQPTVAHNSICVDGKRYICCSAILYHFVLMLLASNFFGRSCGVQDCNIITLVLSASSLANLA